MLQAVLDDLAYTCGAQLDDLNLEDRLKESVAMKGYLLLRMAKLYYSVGT